MHDLPDWLQDFREKLVDESSPLEEPRGNPAMLRSRDTSNSSHLNLTTGVASKSGTRFGKAQCRHALSEGPNLRYLLANQNYKGFLQKTHWRSSFSSRTLWWLDHSRSQSSQWRLWIGQQSSISRCGTRFGNSVVTILPMWNKNFSGNKKELTKVLGAKETKSHLHWQLPRIWQRLWRIILESLLRQRRTERAVRRVKEWDISGTVAVSAGTLNGRRILWNVTAICETFKISCLMGRHPTKGGSEYHLTDQFNTVWSNGRTSPYLCEGHMEITSILSKGLAMKIPRLCIVCGRNLERRHCDRRRWRIGKRWKHLKSMLGDSMRRKCWRPKNVVFFFFFFDIPGRRWNSQNPWRRSTSETIHLNQGSSWTMRGTRSFSRRTRRTLFSNPTSRWLNTGWCGS